MLDFLPFDMQKALSFLNVNLLTEIRLRRGHPVIIEYSGEYNYLTALGVKNSSEYAIICDDVAIILNAAMNGDVFSYSEQLKNGFITVNHGVRIGVAGEYVTESGKVVSIKTVTSLNIRLPHNVSGCSDYIYNKIYLDNLCSALIFSCPGFGKTTILRDLAMNLSARKKINVLVFDERREISAMDGDGIGYDLGNFVDVVRCFDKLSAIKSAIRAMKPQVIITDELYGTDDVKAVEYASDCGICIIASSHTCTKEKLIEMPFDFYVELTGIGKRQIIYDKNFNPCGDSRSDDGYRIASVNRKT